MADPVGELLGKFEEAVRQGVTLEQLARYVAPDVVLRTQLTHVGWVCERGHDVDDSLTVEKMCDECEAVFTVPPRVVPGGLHTNIEFGIGVQP